MRQYLFRITFEGGIEGPDDIPDNGQPITPVMAALSEIKESAVRYINQEQRGLTVIVDRIRTDVSLVPPNPVVESDN